MMAEVTIDTPVNIETDEEKDGHRRRYSNGNFDDQNRVAKREPRYLSASSGSCHDLCKHGFKSVPETKVRRSLQRRNSLDSTRKTAKTSEVMKKEISESSKKVTISLRRQTSSPAEIKYASEKHLRAPKPKISSLAATQRLRRRHSEIFMPKDSEPLYMSSAGGSSGQTNSEKKVNKEKENSKIEKKKILVRERFSLSSMSSTQRILSAQSEYVKKLKKVPTALKNRKRIKEVENEQPPSENVIEKTLYVIGPQAKNQAVGLARSGSFTSSLFSEEKGLGYGECTVKASHSPPTENTHASLFSIKSQSSTSSSPEAMHGEDSAFDIDNSETENPITDLEVENTRTPRIQVHSLEDKDWPPSQKLQFRRGNVIDVQFKNRSPSLLKFRHREALDENQNGISDTRGRRSLRRIASDGVLYQTKSETVKVALKHQDTETKEETWGLFNDVIKETANRLVQSRKSKVKALVGAFEAVLCRQDSKSVEMNRT